MAAPTLIPIELYLHSACDYEPDAEYVDGEIELRPMGEYDHTNWQTAILQWFLLHTREWNIRVRPEQRVQVNPTRYRVPDVVVFDHSPGSHWSFYVAEEERVRRSAEAMKRFGIRRRETLHVQQHFKDYVELLAKVAEQGTVAMQRVQRFAGTTNIVIPMNCELALL